MTNARVRYQTLDFGDDDVHVRSLRDDQQFDDPDGEAEDLGISSAAWPIFGVLWPSGRVLAEHLHTYPVDGRRVLEVGCGIALTSLVLNGRDVDITATDRHPEAGKFLRENVRLNDGSPIPFVRVGWADPPSELGLFDLIVGSDLLYERGHPAALATFIDQHAEPECDVVLVDPGRGEMGRFDTQMRKYGFALVVPDAEVAAKPERRFKGRILSYHRSEAA